ncbi:unnamed protein product [Orchesella dallaii]|uniref:SNF2 N-terminal domain-containing protein n=1 Tax=Orchesella dallaii TaxID=48710 RepID=A0ABP1QLT4_9HEXA
MRSINVNINIIYDQFALPQQELSSLLSLLEKFGKNTRILGCHVEALSSNNSKIVHLSSAFETTPNLKALSIYAETFETRMEVSLTHFPQCPISNSSTWRNTGLATGLLGKMSHMEFKDWFSNPMSRMLERSKEYTEDIVRRLYKVLRLFILCRMKSEVEKQLPRKHEHVVMVHCPSARVICTRTSRLEQLSSITNAKYTYDRDEADKVGELNPHFAYNPDDERHYFEMNYDQRTSGEQLPVKRSKRIINLNKIEPPPCPQLQKP